MKKEFSLKNVNSVLKELSTRDGIFVSEAHLQTEFIIEAAKQFPSNRYYPEFVPANKPEKYNKGVHFDLLIETNSGQTVIVEFKYHTKPFFIKLKNLEIRLKNQQAHDLKRYDCWKDIERIESFVNESFFDHGYFVFITNNNLMWENSSDESIDTNFLVNEGLHKKSIKSWRKNPSAGTIKGRNKSIEINYDYDFKYNVFKDFNEKNGTFKFLIVEIEKEN